MKKFPKIIHITDWYNSDAEDQEFEIRDPKEILENSEDGQQVAVYKLVKIGRVSVTKKIQFPKDKK